MSGHNVNCQWNDKGYWCTNKKIRRSLWGIGARECQEYNTFCHKCPECKPWPRPVIPPPAPPKTRGIDLEA